MRTINYKKSLVFPLFLIMIFCQQAFAIALYKIIDPAGIEHPHQSDSVDTLRSQPTTKDLYVGEINAIELSNKVKNIQLPIKNDSNIEVELKKFQSKKDGVKIWKGHVISFNGNKIINRNEIANFVTLIQANHRIRGIISFDDKKYTIESLSNDKVVVVEVDDSKYPEHGEPIPVDKEKQEQISNDDTAKNYADNKNTISNINVLMIVTPESLSAIGQDNYPSFVALASELLKDTVTNSHLAINYKIIPIISNISEDGKNFDQLLADMRNNATPLGAFIEQQRNLNQGDLVSLIVDATGYCGLAYLTNGSVSRLKSHGFSVVTHRCVPDYTLGHEIGHNLGAAHERHIATNPYFPYGYGYQYTKNLPYWRTIMAYQCSPSACLKINAYSSPNLFNNNLPMGTENEDNVRVIEQTRFNAANVFPK